MRDRLTARLRAFDWAGALIDLIGLIGLLLLCGGLYFVYWPLALIVPGVVLMVYSVAAARAREDDGP